MQLTIAIKYRLLRRSLRCVLIALLLGTGAPVYGQSFMVSVISSKYIKAPDYDSLIRNSALPVALGKHVSETDFLARYPNYRPQFAEILIPLLHSRFASLDRMYVNAGAAGSPGYKKARLHYLKEAGRVIETLFESAATIPGLFAIDNSDRILSFHSDITVMNNGKINVSEFITIFNGNGETSKGFNENASLNDDIQRGIVRDFPTSYQDSSGFWSHTGFDLKRVLKNGLSEPYNTESVNNGTRIKIGRKEVVLPAGIYIYQLDYETDRQLIFHPDKDELYWNVNGNGWVFTADSVSCNVHFPSHALIKEHACYTGRQGASEHECDAHISGDNSIWFSTTQRLNSYEGLTIAVSIEKGVIIPPGKIKNMISFFKANYIIPSLGSLLLFLLVYYFYIWYRKGRDPLKGTIYPQFSPLPEITPPDAGYILDQRYGPHLFTAALVDCAVKKSVSIEVSKKGLLFKSSVYEFTKPANLKEVPSTKSVYGFELSTLYGQKAQKGHYNSVLFGCYSSLEETLKERFLIRGVNKNKWYGLFALNKGYTAFGAVVLVVALFLSVKFMITHASIYLLVITLLMLGALMIVHFIFAGIMTAYSKRGREIADHLLGFKMYLDKTEQKVFDQLAPPEKTLDLFEKYLPYAIAFRVENNWASKFSGIMQKAIEAGYQPAYYYYMSNGSFSSFSMNDMSRGISSGLTNTISSASTPPSSSSGGSAGGGRSGGGGGGGGGGGW